MNTNVNIIPLSKLAAWKGNVRKTHSEFGVTELAESIAVHGLLQSLVIAAAPVKGKHQVIAGRRRLLALQSLAKAGRIEADLPVPCAVATDGIDLTELSLAENVMRVAMHPADDFEAFKSLIDKGATIAQSQQWIASTSGPAGCSLCPVGFHLIGCPWGRSQAVKADVRLRRSRRDRLRVHSHH